ncbi:MAG: metallophosphoesterase family protein [Granulosicoccaceae bacterium]|jgi:putative phosphoesterase
MSRKIGLLSDVHAFPAPVEEALALFRQNAVQHILCAGDIAGYGNDLDATVALLREHACRSITGNHDLWYLEDTTDAPDHPTVQYLRGLPAVIEMTVEGVRLYMVHASPPDSCIDGIRLLDQQGELLPELWQAWAGQLQGFGHDVLIVGHTHQLFAEQLGDTLVINPGSTRFNHSCAILTLPECTVEWLPLSNRTPQRVWNWSDEFKS